MFRCCACGSTEFKLMLRPGLEAEADITLNEHDEVTISITQPNAKSHVFVADLAFINQFGYCSCETTGQWEYYFPKQEVPVIKTTVKATGKTPTKRSSKSKNALKQSSQS